MIANAFTCPIDYCLSNLFPYTPRFYLSLLAWLLKGEDIEIGLSAETYFSNLQRIIAKTNFLWIKITSGCISMQRISSRKRGHSRIQAKVHVHGFEISSQYFNSVFKCMQDCSQTHNRGGHPLRCHTK